MSTTTQILFNSPALHSLKRDQLVKLCKIHSLKPSGKKTELIERLQLHAKSLPPDDPLSVATRSENPLESPIMDSEDEGSDCSGEGSSSMSGMVTRPSQQWELVMDAIEEVDEDTKNSLRSNRGASHTSAGEFGTNTSKGGVTSSLRAIANSLGLKRHASKVDATTSSTSSSLSSKEAGQSSSTLPTSEPNADQEEQSVAPIPGQTNLEGLPAPFNARLSLSQAQATTTIRLVSTAPANQELLFSPPKLKPFATTFDLLPPTPGGADSSMAVWPLSPGRDAGTARESLYPAVPSFQVFGDLLTHPSLQTAQADASDMDIDLDTPGGLGHPSVHGPTPRKANNSARFNTGATPKSSEKPSAEPVDIFSPAPKAQSASSRARLAIPRSEPFVFGSQQPQDNLSNLQFRVAAQSVLDEMNKRLAEEGVEGVDLNVLNNRPNTEETNEKAEPKDPVRAGDMFDKVHQKAFDKMDSIATHYAAKRVVPSTASQPILSKKRKSSLVIKDRKPGEPPARHRPSGTRVASGASTRTMLPAGFGEEEEDEDGHLADRRLSKRPRVEREESDAPEQPEQVSFAPPPPDPEEEARKQKEREAIRRRLDHNKAKRRSSMGRPSLGRASIGRAPPPKPKPSRFGFLSSAKTLVQNVWNRGAGSKAPVTKPAAEPKVISKATESKKIATVPGSSGAPPVGTQTKRIPSGGSSSGQLSTSGRSHLAPPGMSNAGGSTGTSGRTSRAPIPSFDAPSSSTSSNHRSSTVSRIQSRSGSAVGLSSLGAKPSIPAGSGQVSSLGGKPSSRNLVTNTQKPSGIPRSRTMSTLMAPTASSLAKANANRVPGSLASHNENSSIAKAGSSSKSQRFATSPQPSAAALEQITNSPRSPAEVSRPTKIFSQPLSPPSARTPMSLTATATTIVGKAADEKSASSSSKPPLPPKPKVLPGRRPRISRSKVIARLASQREAGTSATPSAKASGKTRSSVGAGVAGKARQSYGGARGGDVLLSAKKRIRQSEYARRRSRAPAGEGAMNLDP